MDIQTKIIIAGVGGQGIVFLTEILVNAAVVAGIPVATSEIHGLSQRGGSVTAGITFGKNTFGTVEEGDADFLLGLELLETQRCVNYLHQKSVVITDNTKIVPHSVNAQKGSYPDTTAFIEYLKKNTAEVIFINDEKKDFLPVMRNIVVLAKAVLHKDFPVKPEYIERAIRESSRGNMEKILNVFTETVKFQEA